MEAHSEQSKNQRTDLIWQDNHVNYMQAALALVGCTRLLLNFYN